MRDKTPFVAWTTRLHCLACALLAALLAPLAAAAQPVMVLGVGDSVRVMVLENPELTTETRVSLGGTLGMPLLGEVTVVGRTPLEAAGLITEQLRSSKYLRDPHVSVTLLEAHSRRVQVLGHVARPGQYVLDGRNENLTDILAMAGGRTEDGSDRVVVTRRDGGAARFEVDIAGMYRDGDLSRDLGLQAGDVVYVPSAPVFYVYGAVQRAGVYRLEAATSVRAALSIGGGLTPRGSQNGIRIHRRMPDGSVRELRAGLADPLQADDVIYVRESLF